MHKHRPDLILTVGNASPIPDTPPASNKFENQLMYAKDYVESIDPTGWWMSEKLDGLRVYWSGTTLHTKSGRIIMAPPFFVEKLPNVPLDGELW